MGHLRTVCRMNQRGSGTFVNMNTRPEKNGADELREQISQLNEQLRKMESKQSNASPTINEAEQASRSKRQRIDEVEASIDALQIDPPPKREILAILDSSTAITATVDPGADVPLVGFQTYFQLTKANPHLKLEDVDVVVRVADKRPLKVLGGVQTTILVCGELAPITLVVVEQPLGFYLDYHTLGQLGFLLDPMDHGLQKKNTGEFFPFRYAVQPVFNTVDVDEISVISSQVLTAEQTQEFNEVLKENQTLFDPPTVSTVDPVVLTAQSQWDVKGRRKHYSPDDQVEIKKQLDKMLQGGIIKEVSGSPFVSSITLANKSDGSKRFCINFTRINKMLEGDQAPIPLIDELVEQLKGSHFYISLDLAQAYWQLGLTEESKKFTAFVYDDKVYVFNVLPFGLKGAGAIFQSRMKKLFFKLWKKGLIIYIDDLLIYAKTWLACLTIFKEVCQILNSVNLKLKFKKCDFFPKTVKYLGFEVDGQGYRPIEKKVAAILTIKAPSNRAGIQQLLGFFGYFRRFIRDYGKIADPLAKLLQKSEPFVWDSAQEQAPKKRG
eukprot:GHVU01206525.1.p1 GENE.GHVU01206525.1~~GHVU01206525.1.p1  ORF type:complete len:572 (+),score=51.35 GHVU01206525.1:62-1717(+)